MGWAERREGLAAEPRARSVLNGRPLYLQLRDLMVARIVEQHWKVGDALPNEVLLSKEFSVSVGTVRKAMDELSTEGLVRRHQGRGTFIADRQAAATRGLFDRIRTSDGRFVEWAQPEMSFLVALAEPEERRALELARPDAQVVRFRRLRASQQRPLVLEFSAVPEARFNRHADLTMHGADIATLAQAFRIILGKSEIQLRATQAPEAVAQSLGIEAGSAVQRLDRVVYDIDDLPVEVSRSWLALTDEYYSCRHTLPDGVMD